MTGADLKTARKASGWTQAKAALQLGVTQAYLSMLESGNRSVSGELASVALRVFSLPPTLRPLGAPRAVRTGEEFFKRTLGELGYPGFVYLKGRSSLNPAELLFLALDSEELDARVTEALPWLPLQFPAMDWSWLGTQCKRKNRQNRLAYILSVASEIAKLRGETRLFETLRLRIAELEPSRLANEDTLAKQSLSQAERRWLRAHRPSDAEHWNLLTDMRVENLHFRLD